MYVLFTKEEEKQIDTKRHQDLTDQGFTHKISVRTLSVRSQRWTITPKMLTNNTGRHVLLLKNITVDFSFTENNKCFATFVWNK